MSEKKYYEHDGRVYMQGPGYYGAQPGNGNNNPYLTQQMFHHLNVASPNFPAPNNGLSHLTTMDAGYVKQRTPPSKEEVDALIDGFVDKSSKKQCIRSLEKIVRNVRHMHLQASTEEKSSVLGLVALALSRRQLDDLGFKFTSNQYQKAVQKQRDGELNFVSRSRPVKNTKKRVAIDERIEQILTLNSDLIQNEKYIDDQGRELPVYKLKCSRRDIYDVVRNQGIKMSISNFYKRIPLHFRPQSAK